MALATVATVATLAAEFGPAVLRGIGSLFGGKTQDVALDLANVVEHVESSIKDPAQKEQKIQQLVSQLPPEALVELEKIKVELEREHNRRLELQLNDAQAEHHETQTTIRAGDVAEDEYVRQTRPKGARISLYASIGYVFLFDLLSAFDKGTGANFEIAGMLIAPFLTYMGWRELGKRTQAKYGTQLTVQGAVKQGLNTLKTLPAAVRGNR